MVWDAMQFVTARYRNFLHMHTYECGKTRVECIKPASILWFWGRMAVNNLFRVTYHFENSTSHKAGWDGPYTVTVIAADAKEATIKSVLSSNGIGRPGASLAIDHVSHEGAPGGGGNVLS